MGSGADAPASGGDAGETDGESGGGSGPSDGIDDRIGRREFALAGAAVAVLLVAVALGVGPFGGQATGGDAGVSDASAPSVTTTPTPTPGSGSAASTAAPPAPDVTMRVRSIESCGTRCRAVTVALSNAGDGPARDVRVSTDITADGSLIWEGSSAVGRLAAGETVTRTRTVEVGYVDAARIEANDGVVRIETTIRTAGGTRTFTERRDVS